MVTVRVGEFEATLQGMTWTGDPLLVDMFTQDMVLYAAPATVYDPFPELAIAQDIARRYAGIIVEQKPPGTVEGRVY